MRSGFFKRLKDPQLGAWLGMSLIVGLSIYGQITLKNGRAWVEHTFEVLEQVQQLEFKLLDAQADLDVYLDNPLTSNLSAYERDVDDVWQTINEIQTLTADNEKQQQSLKVLRVLLNRRLQAQKGLIQKPTSEAGARSLLYTNEIHEQIALIQQEEKWLLEIRRKSVQERGMLTTGLLILGVAASGGLFFIVGRQQKQQQQTEFVLNKRLKTIELEQDLSSHLLSCRSFEEANDILRSFLSQLLPNSSGVIYRINNSRDQMEPALSFGEIKNPQPCSPRECWALRRGAVQVGNQTAFKVPCKLCESLQPDGGNARMCLPLQAYEQTLGILYLDRVPGSQHAAVGTLAHQISLPLAILQLQAEREYLTFHDPVTGLYNRRALDELLVRTIVSAQRKNARLGEGEQPYCVGILVLDVDHFKRFNDQYGHETGDAVLNILGSYLLSVLRQGDDIPCRYGGEEFVVVLGGASEADTLAKAEKIREGIKDRPTPAGVPIKVSIGVAMYPHHGSSAGDLLKKADMALYKAKADGRDRVVLAD